MSRTSRLHLLFASACAAVLLCSQVLGLHYHRHVSGSHHGPVATADRALATMWDPGAHFHAPAGGESGHQAAHSAHPDQDLDVEVLGEGAAKFKKGSAQVAIPPSIGWAQYEAGSHALAPTRDAPPERTHTFRLKPPSQAPPSLPC